MVERWKMTPNPKRRNCRMAEQWKIPRNHKRQNDGKSPEFLKDGMMENHPFGNIHKPSVRLVSTERELQHHQNQL